MENTFNAPLASIEINGVKVGLIKDLSFTENIQRGEVQGLGAFTLQEVPALSMRCTFTASSYSISLKKFGTIKDPFWPVDAGSPTKLVNTLLLGEKPVNIHIYKKTAGPVDANGIVTEEGNMARMAVIENCYLDSKTWNLAEGGIAGKNISGRYLTPVNLI